ncbi:unnamed protein product [Somion occarium]|uniref:Macro domain-like protein n=1 Tax=Somion occarium TaxID=3059160 RepID=A0ABP1CT35_9APHY
MDDLQFTILDPGKSLTPELQKAIGEHIPNLLRHHVTICQTTLAELGPPCNKFDCIVSPANSYGRLDGGFDYYLSEALAPAGDIDAPTRLAQSTLYKKWRGYAPPGTCTLVSLKGTSCEHNKHDCAYIALCPTMRTPEIVTWNKEIVYNCIWSLLTTISNHNSDVNDKSSGTKGRRIKTVVMTGLATGVGLVSAARYAQQMALAMRDFVDASANPMEWSTLSWGEIKKYAGDTRKTHDL